MTWSAVEDGFYVASRGTVLVGFVDRIAAENYQLCDAQAHLLGFFGELETAMARLESMAGPMPRSDPGRSAIQKGDPGHEA